ncbi:MAG: phenylalanine--tRNA ligase subunit beta [Desulfuromonadales bacterium]|nr:phenylalanine--tRNA ligase subunit beta [Desulfuromonadales bacterium]
MIVTYNWLKEFVDFDMDPQQLADRLTMAGLEVDGMVEIGAGLDSVIVARLNSVEPHPDADRLTVCQVDNGSEVVQVVCGATNHKTGDLIALAQPGTVLPGDFKIKKSKIRGQVSMGMLCSEKELGFSEESAGIMILPPELEPGVPLFDALKLKDVQIEIGLTPNRPDCLSVVGVAREVAAMCGKPLQLPEATVIEGGRPVEDQASVTIRDDELCPRYAARVIRDVKIGPSPSWMVSRLESVGMRSINNVVDVTNYVMMELGHPLHAFDYRLLENGEIIVKRASAGDRFVTLDGQEHELDDADLMICDGNRPVAMAGVMGGQNSEVQDDTSTILLESAYFKPTSIRRTSKRHGLHTESSHRFERGADIDMVPVALNRAAALIAELSGGQVAAGVIDNYPRTLVPRIVELRTERIGQILGLELEQQQVVALLESIALGVEVQGNGLLHVEVPSFRPDLERDVDLIEEVARLYGYDNVPVTLPQGAMDAEKLPLKQQIETLTRDELVAAGFAEVINYSFVAPQSCRHLNLPEGDPRLQQVRILNPLNEEQSVMRTSLVPSLLETVSRNLAYRSHDLRLFELRPVFFPVAGETGGRQELRLAAVLCGRQQPEGWAQSSADVDFFDLKGVAERLLEALKVGQVDFNAEMSEPYLHPGKSCAVMKDGVLLGTIGEIHPQVLATFDIDEPVFLLDFSLAELVGAAGGHPGFQPLSRYPDVSRDSALLIDETVPASAVMEIVAKTRVKYVEDTVLFDIYQGAGIPPGKKSLAIRVRYRSTEKTLTEEEVSKAHGKLVMALCQQLEAEIR